MYKMTFDFILEQQLINLPVVAIETNVTMMKKMTKIISILIWNQRNVDKYRNQFAVCIFRALWNNVSKYDCRPKALSVQRPFKLVTRCVKIGLLAVKNVNCKI